MHCVCNFCVMYCFECVCVILFFCVLYSIVFDSSVLCIVVPLTPGTYALAVNNNKRKNISVSASRHSCKCTLTWAFCVVLLHS